MKAAGTHQVVKIDISATEASLSIVRDGKPFTWAWANGAVVAASSDIADVQQTSFNPDSFNIDNVGALFEQAAKVSKSTSSQQLQIVEYNQGQVLMTVTTNPESATVFFRPDATMVNIINFGSSGGIEEALKDAVGTSTSVVAIGYRPSSGLYVQTVGQQSGTVDETTRPFNLPRWTATLKATSYQAFDPQVVRPAVIANILGALRSPSASASASSTASASRLPSASPRGASSPAAGSTSASSPATSSEATESGPATSAGTPGASGSSASAGTPASTVSAQQPNIAWVIDRRDRDAAQPVMRFTMNGQTFDYTIAGVDVTALYEGQ